MNATVDPHEHFAQLAAGYALGALEPDEEQTFRTHLDSCERCTKLAAEFGDVAGGLATLSAGEDPPAELWTRIHGAIVDEGGPPVIVMSERARTRPRVSMRAIAIAASVAAVVAIGSWQVLSRSGSVGQDTQAAIRSCQHSSSCTSIQLLGRGTRQADAVLLIRGQDVQLVPTHLSPVDASRQTYVLWQLPRDGRPAGVLSFAVGAANSQQPIERGTLPLPYAVTTAFALTRENGTTIPAAPSRLLAIAPAA